ncbi:hypothetical protein J6590_095227, partial [Homalodisca vitripennis]
MPKLTESSIESLNVSSNKLQRDEIRRLRFKLDRVHDRWVDGSAVNGIIARPSPDPQTGPDTSEAITVTWLSRLRVMCYISAICNNFRGAGFLGRLIGRKEQVIEVHHQFWLRSLRYKISFGKVQPEQAVLLPCIEATPYHKLPDRKTPTFFVQRAQGRAKHKVDEASSRICGVIVRSDGWHAIYLWHHELLLTGVCVDCVLE